MGLYDTAKSKAGDLARDAGRAGKVTAAQANIVLLLQQDLKKAERELGRATLPLIERDELDHPDLIVAAERVRAAQAAIDDKRAEIAELRAPSDEAEDAADETVIEATVVDETADDAPVEEESPSA